MTNLISKFVKNESGATAIEYGLIASLIAVACIAIWTATGTALIAKFGTINTALR